MSGQRRESVEQLGFLVGGPGGSHSSASTDPGVLRAGRQWLELFMGQ